MLLPVLAAAALPSIDNLPSPIEEGYSLELGEACVRTDMDIGPARVRRVSSDPPDTLTLAWLLDDAQMAEFRAWFRDQISSGSLWFRLRIADGWGGLTVRECRFVGSPQLGLRAGLNWSPKARVEVR